MSSGAGGPKGDQNTFGEDVSKLGIGHTEGIEKAYARSGADKHHTPGHAFPLGNKESKNVQKVPGMGAAEGKSQEPSALGKMVDHMLNGKET